MGCVSEYSRRAAKWCPREMKRTGQSFSGGIDRSGQKAIEALELLFQASTEPKGKGNDTRKPRF